jgi:peptide/nickel transport system substrate-binding protein
MVANPNYWGGEPVIDRVVFRIFTNPDAMVAALQQGEIDAAHLIPASSFDELQDDPDIVAVDGRQGGLTEVAMNGMAGGIGDGHPALLDLDVRHAIAHAIDRDLLFDRIVLGHGEKGAGLSVSADPAWQPDIPEEEQYNYDPDEARRLLDEGGYVDTNGDGTREMPGGGRELVFRYAERSESVDAAAIREFVTGFLTEIGIGTEVSVYDDTQLTDVIASGEYDMFSWTWTPFVDPDPMLSYFTCANVTYDIESVGYNDANWCDERYDALYEQQKVELDRDKRIEIVHEMLRLFYHESTYVVLYWDADTQAYRTDRFEGWLRQPAEIGPVLFSNSSPTYANLTLVGEGDATPDASSPDDGSTTSDPSAAGDDDGGISGVAIALIAVAAIVVIGGVVLVMRSRKSRDERE